MASTLAERLKERMTALKMSPAELARQAGVKPPSVFLWQDGTTKNIKYASLLKTARALEVTPEWLATGVGRKFMDEPESQHAINDAGAYYGDATIVEAVKLLEGMSSSARVEALSFLKVFAAKKGVQPANGAGATLPAATRHAA